MAKLGLCACYSNHNFGSMLQALATCEALEDLGCEYELVRYKRSLSISRLSQLALKVFTLDAWIGLVRDIKWKFYLRGHVQEQARHLARSNAFDQYCHDRFKSTGPVFEGFEALKLGSNRYSAVMVGSDQLWLPSGYSSKYYTLEFAAEGVRRISYATSFGISSMPKSSFSAARDFLTKIDYLSVRESSGVRIVKDVTSGKVDAKLVVDPTLLFDSAGWDKIIPQKRLVEDEYIFCYFLGTNPSSRELLSKLKAATGLKVVMLRDWHYHLAIDEQLDDGDFFTANPDDFVNLIRHATYVLTDSFHGTVFSLINHKHFGTFYRDANGANSRNTRIDSLFEQLGTSSRLMTNADLDTFLNFKVDYSKVDSVLDSWRSDSRAFLKGAIDGI